MLGIMPPSLDGIKSVEEAEQRCVDFKAGPLNKRWREIAREHHPDKGPPEEVDARTARMAEFNEAYETVRDDLHVVVTPKPQPVPMRQGFTVTIVRGGGSPWSSPTTSSATGDWEW
jgi:hypothetical protein